MSSRLDAIAVVLAVGLFLIWRVLVGIESQLIKLRYLQDSVNAKKQD